MRRAQRAFTLVELMIVVAIVGILAVLAIYGVRKYMQRSKSAEARAALGQITKGAAAAFEKESGSATVLPDGTASGVSHNLCPSAAKVPGTPPKGEKYQSSVTDWNADPGWQCLLFSMGQAQYYSYSYVAPNTSGINGSYSAIANGDLNGDGNYSTFQVDGRVQSGMLTVSPAIAEVSPDD